MEIKILYSRHQSDNGYGVVEMTVQQLIELLQESAHPDWKVQVGEYLVCSTFTRDFENKVVKFGTKLA